MAAVSLSDEGAHSNTVKVGTEELLRISFASKIRNVDGKILGKDGRPMRKAIRFQELVKVGEIVSNNQVTNPSNSSNCGSFASVVQHNALRKVVKVSELRNKETVHGAAIAIPLEAVKEVSARFENTLYGYFVGKKLAFPLVENYVKNTWIKFGLDRVMNKNGFFYFQFSTRDGMEKVIENGPWLIRSVPLILNVWTPNAQVKKDDIKVVPVWVKLRHVPVLAYSKIGLSLITTQLGRPIMLDSYTCNMCINPRGKSDYDRALIQVSIDVELTKSVVVAIPFLDNTGLSLETVDVEYEWTPPRCGTCCVFDHNDDNCPKKVHVNNTNVVEVSEDGFTTIVNRKKKGKGPIMVPKKSVGGFKVTKSKNFVYQPVKPKDNGSKPSTSEVQSVDPGDDNLNVIPTPIDDDGSESELEEVYVESNPNVSGNKGASTPYEDDVVNENQLSVCTILESQVDISSLAQVCSKVFKYWEWTSNANMCMKGCRIILGWNLDVVNVMVLSQTNQVMHVKIMHKKSNKYMFCSIIYAGNLVSERRLLWDQLVLHKQVVRGQPWTLLSDFNVALNLEDYHLGPSSLNSAMVDFKDYVAKTEVMDINSSGLHFTWNQKPRGGGGVLKKLDRIMGNVEFFVSRCSCYLSSLPYLGSLAFGSSNVAGQHMYQLTTKLKCMKKHMRKLVHDHGNLHERVDKLRVELDEIQKALDKSPSNSDLRDEEAVYVNAFNEAKLDEERFLKQKAKIEWLDVEDTNSAYFYKAIKSHNQRNRIESIINADNIMCSGPGVQAAFVQHYESFLGTDMPCDALQCEGLFNKKISEASCSNMVRHISNKEIKSAMFSIGDDKSPGPDGYTSMFFKRSWDIVGYDVCKAVTDFFNNGLILREINHTFLALIPKVSTPSRINDFRPISCCNVIYKCISKILTNCIIEGIKEVVSDNQSAFVLGRRITDNILITQELMHGYHLDKGTPRCAFKIDIQKAYDTVDWKFLEVILWQFGFPNLMIRWIMACVTTTSFSISINGDIHGFLKENVGCVKEIHFLLIYLPSLGLVNVCFADDLFIFARGDVNSAKVIMESLDEFKNVSGLVLSLPKSMAFFAMFCLMDCKFLVEKAKNRIGDWKNKSLSYARRLQLCKSVIASMHVYWASVLIIPKGILLDIEQLIRGFLWCNGELKRGKAKVAWHDICLPKKEGGFGIRSLEMFNIVLMTTHIWNLVSNKDSIWVRWINIYKLKGRSVWDVPVTSRFLSARDISREYFSMLASVKDMISNEGWLWPQSWLLKAPILGQLVVPSLDPNKPDLHYWRDSNGVMRHFSVKAVWEEIRPRGPEMSQNPRHASSMRDCYGTDLNHLSYALCSSQADSHEHLFYECSFSSKVCCSIRHLAAMDNVSPNFQDIVSFLQPIATKRTAISIIGRLLFAASSYFLWIERNNRLFKGLKRSPEDVRDIILVTVRLKLLSFKFKNRDKVKKLLSSWNMPKSFRLYGT
uniref:Reverse transcriptase domain-containing protein n=1 Tax=Tanacetum cinerariifolium TaxID=118510 RepID=A0A699GPV5_TANCI|nr:hypothetical protein [Tanacetum cinerariifolium]